MTYSLDSDAVDENSFINDIRDNFSCITFSKYKMTQVKEKFTESLFKNKIEEACHWCAELICSGHFLEIWETFISYYGKQIHLGNTRIAIYLLKRYNLFKNITNQTIFTDILQIRNNKKIRSLFAEIVFILCHAPKKHSIEPLKINRIEEFDITIMTDRLKADATTYVEPVFLSKDPKELFIPLNEFAFNVANQGSNSLLDACYWIEWIVEFQIICKQRKQPCKCERRSYPVESKYQMDVVWLIWDVLKYYCEGKDDDFIEKVMDALIELFCIKYSSGTFKRRRHLLYLAVGILTEYVNKDVEILTAENKNQLTFVIKNVDYVYKNIKKSEESPGVDYLFDGLQMSKKKNIEHSLKKLELLSGVSLPTLQNNL